MVENKNRRTYLTHILTECRHPFFPFQPAMPFQFVIVHERPIQNMISKVFCKHIDNLFLINPLVWFLDMPLYIYTSISMKNIC